MDKKRWRISEIEYVAADEISITAFVDGKEFRGIITQTDKEE